MIPRVKFAVRTLVLVGCGALCVWSTAAETRPVAVESAASLIQYNAPGGDNYFALALRAGSLGNATAHDHVILVDTSASQTGAHRRQALGVLEASLASLPAGDRVRIYAVDVEVKPLLSEFSAPDSAETRSAVKALHERVPLGATNLKAALETARAAFSGERDRSIMYIGDGMSSVRLLNSAELQTLVTSLRNARIAVHSYAVGPRTDLQLLGILAQHTGGVVLVDAVIDDVKLPISQIGEKFSLAARAPVFYPSQISVTPEVDQLLGKVVPPIRSDRDTILLGKGPVGKQVAVAVKGKVSGGTGVNSVLEWTAQTRPVQAGNTFLAGLWAAAEQNEGLAVAVAGSDLLNVARQEYEDHVAQLVAVGRTAVASRHLEQAEQAVQAIRRIDPTNTEADTIQNATEKIKTVRVKLARYQAEAAPAPAADEPPASAKDTSDLIQLEEQAIQVRGEKLTKEVRQTIQAAQKLSKSDASAAIYNLKRLLNTVLSESISPEVREKLRRQIQGVVEELTVTKEKYEAEHVRAQERAAAQRAQFLAVEQLVQRDEKLEQLIDKVRSLLAEGFIGNANAFEEAESVARASWEHAPNSGVTAAAIFDSEAAGQLDKATRLRSLRADKFLETLYQVELSHVPFPDEPPVLWPAPEVWKALTERRKKWASVDLVRYNKIEEKIRAALDKPTDVNFIETTLEDAINFLKDYHNINIWIDRPTILEEGVSLDQTITLQLAGISLRSILKLLLTGPQLTWVIEDEVMKITTTIKASEKLQTRVYPVADLVIPIRTPQGGGIGQGNGGSGGIGGQGGGQGGGQFGGQQGGGGGGFGGGGMGGGGMFNVADDAVQGGNLPAGAPGKKKRLAKD